jgi:hypothetical protein
MFNWSSTLPDTDVTRDPKVSTKINLTNPFNDLKMHRGVTIRTYFVVFVNNYVSFVYFGLSSGHEKGRLR